MAFKYDIPNDQLTDSKVEGIVERMTNSYDRMYMGEAITKETYDKMMKDLDDWAEQQYKWLLIKERQA